MLSFSAKPCCVGDGSTSNSSRCHRSQDDINNYRLCLLEGPYLWLLDMFYDPVKSQLKQC